MKKLFTSRQNNEETKEVLEMEICEDITGLSYSKVLFRLIELENLKKFSLSRISKQKNYKFS